MEEENEIDEEREMEEEYSFMFENDDDDDLYSCQCGHKVQCSKCTEIFCKHNGLEECYNHDIAVGICGICYRNGKRFVKCPYCYQDNEDSE